MASAEELEKLIKKRRTFEVKLTQFEKYMKALEEVAASEHEITELSQRLAVIEEAYALFDNIQSGIEATSSEAEAEFTKREEFDNKYFRCSSWAKVIINTFNNVDVASEKSGALQKSHVSKSQNSIISNAQNLPGFNSHVLPGGSSGDTAVRLPTIDLPRFNGSFDDWLEFKHKFKSLIHENQTIDNVQKLHYLRASLIGAASEVINCLDFTADDYNVAWDILWKKSADSLRKLSDSVSKHTRCLNRLGLPVSSWDIPIIHFVTSKFDTQTITEWEEYHSNAEIPTLDLFIQFLGHKADLLETIEEKLVARSKKLSNFPKLKDSSRSLVVKRHSCAHCKGEHLIFNCDDFLKLAVKDRVSSIKQNKLCMNCLHTGHTSRDCKYGACKKCKQRHNTLLHYDTPNAAGNADSSVTLTSSSHKTHSILLPTVAIRVFGENGRSENVVGLLDSGSQTSFITSRLCNQLKLPLENHQLTVAGLGNFSRTIQQKCNVNIESINGDFCVQLCCFVLPEITGNLPGFLINSSKLKIPPRFRLANPSYDTCHSVDVLIGLDVFWSLLCNGQIGLGKGLPILQLTKFGWIVTGSIPSLVPNSVTSFVSQEVAMDQQLSKFWAIEELPKTTSLSPEEVACEEHFLKTHKRMADSRFIVTIPLRDAPSVLGESRQLAERRLFSLEKRFRQNSSLHSAYKAFLAEYETLGHMSKVTITDPQQKAYYMPHHGVVKESSLTTKLRVVFNASQSTTSGKSFNSIQMVGPVVQQDLQSLLLRFRKYFVVISADIEKMYRQVLIDPAQRPLQRILWRSVSDQTIQAYELNTVTYGAAAASYLATRCLQQIAIELQHENPLISKIISSDFYVDDLLTGCDSLKEAPSICKQVRDALATGGFHLRKFVSNFPDALTSVSSNCSPENQLLVLQEDTTKTLGLVWSSVADSLMYKINAQSFTNRTTKRSLLSCISQIFDPLGLLSPSIIIAKLIMQKIWLLKLSWDSSLPIGLHNEWQAFARELSGLNSLELTRRVVCQNSVEVQLHGYADASERAYGACLYVRSIAPNKHIHVHLLCAKSRVAPLKALSIPRLELCGALLLAQLAAQVQRALDMPVDECVLWTDSTIVLEWLRTPPHTLQTFVRNRVCAIHDCLPSQPWRHASSSNNPADLISRGLKPSSVLNADLWWHGPKWLGLPQDQWPVSSWQPPANVPETKSTLVTFSSTQSCFQFPFNKFSNFLRMKHAASYILRFVSNCKHLKTDRIVGPLFPKELQAGLNLLLRLAQFESFPQEMRRLKSDKRVGRRSRLLNLNPFIDSDGVLRVGGRLVNSTFSYDKRHPAIISNKHIFTKLLLEQEHRRLMHCGPQALLASVRGQYWPVRGRNLSKLIVRNCVRCARFRQITPQPVMGNLPLLRTEGFYPFFTTGVDYAGPFHLKVKGGRVKTLTKAWICLFVCFATKALHLELVSELSTRVFIMALKRFAGRRGIPQHIYSDNGTTFVGANREILEIYKFLSDNQLELSQSLSDQGIKWYFIPAQSPHFGCLWEAGVKSEKHHLKRVVGSTALTYEEFYSFLVQIESILNSRPLTPLSSSPHDMSPLTPAH